MAVYGILLVFNERHRLGAISAFKQFMENVEDNCKVLIVSNRQDSLGENEILGDNTNWEFTGWDKGLNALNIEDHDVVVFANDTFIYHRCWGRKDQRRFKRSILKLKAGVQQGICGEVHKFSGVYHVLGQQSDQWVCTYLFAMSGIVVNKLKRLSLCEASLSKAIIGVENNRILWGDQVSRNLQARIQRWLYPPSGVLGWKKESAVGDDVKLRKAKTILNEKWLTAYCASNGMTIIDAGPDRVTKFYRNAKYRLREVANKVKTRIELG